MLPKIKAKNKNYLKEREKIFKNLSEFPLPSERYTDLSKIPFEKYLKVSTLHTIKDKIEPEDNVVFFPDFLDDSNNFEILKKILKLKKNRILAAHLVFPTGGFFVKLKGEKRFTI